MKVALYARVSSQVQEKRGTIASQVEALRTHARVQGYTVVEEFVCLDDGVSGAILNRPGLDRLRDAAEAGQFDAVLVLSPDRLSRKYAYLILVLEEFERLGTKVLFLEQPPADDPHTALLIQIQGAVAEYQRAKSAEGFRRGKLHRARQGEIFWGDVPFGYRQVPRRDGIPAHVVVNETNAEIVRQVFRWHADEGLSLIQIAKRLTRSGAPTPRGGPIWGATTIHKMVHNEAYTGTLYYNRRCYLFSNQAPDKATGSTPRTQVVQRPRSEWISVSIPAIIDRETFERSQRRHETNRQFSPRRLKEERWLLRRILRCGRCGRKCLCSQRAKRSPDLAPYTYYTCSNQGYRIDRPRCRPSHVRAEPLDALVWREVQLHLTNPELLLRAHGHLKASGMFDGDPLQEQLQAAQRRVKRAESERQRLLDAYQTGFVDRSEFQERTRKLSARIAELQGEVKGLEEERERGLLGKNLLSRIEVFTRSVRDGLNRMGFHERQALVRTVLEEVVLDGQEIHLHFKIPLLPEATDISPEGNVHEI